jgi:DNA-binding response OmpR family regulator
MTAALHGLTIMVVEDEFLVANLIEHMLEDAGCAISGPFPRLAEAVDGAKREPCDAAILDVNLAGERIFPVAEILARRNIPFMFVTGYDGGSMPLEYAGCPRLHKPFKSAELLHALRDLLRPAA